MIDSSAVYDVLTNYGQHLTQTDTLPLSSFTQVTAAEEEGDTMTVDMVVAEVDMTTVGIKKRTRRKLVTKLLG